MKLKQFIDILNDLDVESEVEFDVKGIDSIQDFGRIADIYSDGETTIIEVI